MPKTPHFTPELPTFLRQLKRNNNRDWFAANKKRYEEVVRDPMLQFIKDVAPKLKKISPQFVADPKTVGGSLFRIYRDTRFSRDKSPYKTWAAMQFRHRKGKDVHAPGFYLHIEPDNVFTGVGIWHPDSDTLSKIREAIAEKPPAWKRAIGAKTFKSKYELVGESLKRAPKGYDPEHPLIDDLKRKDFIAVANFNPKDLIRADFIDRFAQTAATATPFMKFLTGAVGVRW